ncbi:MAG: IclR family transcriptional regulator [Alphaproteobacteria bacterium]|nr:IclR family transcriptional regulator [Alphaproteobacteria bacterium]
MDRDKKAPTGTVSRALNLLAVLADADGPVTIKYVADTMGLAPSTAHRLLALLKDEGFVADVLESRSYTIGAQFYRVSARVVSNSGANDFIREVMKGIVETYDETVLFGQFLPTENSLSFSIRCDGGQKLLYQIEMHKPLSLVWGASGKAILAHLPMHRIAEILSAEGPAPGDGAPPPTLGALQDDLTRLKLNGYAISYGEKLPGSRGIAVPVYDRSGVIGSICMTSPAATEKRADNDQIGKDLAARARQLSLDLGARLDD